MSFRRRGHLNGTAVTMPPVGGNGHRGAVVVVCGEHLDAADRTACAAQASEEGASERRDVPDLVIVQGLCAHPERVSDFWRKARPEALVAVACTQTGAARAAEQAVADGMDAARVAAISLAPGLALEPPEARVRWVAATCRAGSQRARLLVGQPKAGRIPWRAGQTLSRRTLLGDLRGPPSRSAHIDGARCWGAERCSRCRSDCPTGAIRTGTVPQVDLQACVSCGRCVTTCPTGAISMPGADLTGLAAEVDTFLAAGVSDLAVTCARRSTPDNCTVPPQAGGPQAVVTLPCVAMFGPGARLGVLASGARLRIEPCDSCGCHQTVEADARFVDRLLALTGGVPEHPVAVEADPGGRGIGWCEPEATNAAVAALLGGSNSADPATHGPPTLDPGAPTRVVRIDDTRCTACGSCALACPTAALSVDTPGRPLTVDSRLTVDSPLVVDSRLAVDSSQCIGCGQCTLVCPEDAIAVQHGIDIGAVLHGPTAVQVPSGEQVCARCGARTPADPMVASVQRRLAAEGRSPALIASLQRCPACAGSRP